MALQRVSIGFAGSHVLSVKIEDSDLDTLLQSLPNAQWHDLPVDDGTIRMNLGQVLYIRTDREEQRVGFGLG